MGSLFMILGASAFLVLGTMTLLWVYYLFRRNAAIVDVGWALGFVFTILACFLFGAGDFWKKIILTAMVLVWSCRLGWHLFQRYVNNPEEDPRYRDLKKKWSAERPDFKMFVLFIFQGVLVLLLSIPFIIVSNYSNSEWTSMETLGIIVWLIGVAGEAIADGQLQNFKRKHPEKEAVCQDGLWYYSRHPNYFFEWIVWIGFFLFAFPSPGGILAIVAPILMFYLLFFVSGIPMTEAEALRSKGMAYKEYQKTTSSFLPWFKF